MAAIKEQPKKASDDPKERRIGHGAFEQPKAETASAEEQEKRLATDEQKAKGEHPLTNVPNVTEMGTLTRSQSPSRIGFEKLTAGGGEEAQSGNIAGQPGEGDGGGDYSDAKKKK